VDSGVSPSPFAPLLLPSPSPLCLFDILSTNVTGLQATITGLNVNTSYEIRVAAYNAAGIGSYTNTLTATTLPLSMHTGSKERGRVLRERDVIMYLYLFFVAAPTNTGNVTFVENSRSAIVVNWTRPVDDGGVSNVFFLVRFASVGANFSNATQVTDTKHLSLPHPPSSLPFSLHLALFLIEKVERVNKFSFM
jgi:hypothetical protein